jgi:hypothetical protein
MGELPRWDEESQQSPSEHRRCLGRRAGGDPRHRLAGSRCCTGLTGSRSPPRCRRGPWAGPFEEAAEGTRTLDLLHGKRFVASSKLALCLQMRGFYRLWRARRSSQLGCFSREFPCSFRARGPLTLAPGSRLATDIGRVSGRKRSQVSCGRVRSAYLWPSRLGHADYDSAALWLYSVI